MPGDLPAGVDDECFAFIRHTSGPKGAAVRLLRYQRLSVTSTFIHMAHYRIRGSGGMPAALQAVVNVIHMMLCGSQENGGTPAELTEAVRVPETVYDE